MDPDWSRKARLCVAACNEQAHGLFTTALTIERISIRILLASIVTGRLELDIRGVTKAFVMSKKVLRRPVYTHAPKETGIEKAKVVRVARLVYAIPESPMHRYKTSMGYHKHMLIVTTAAKDPYLVYHK